MNHTSLAPVHEVSETFNPWDDAMMHDILGNERLAKPVQSLLITLSQINTTDDSFGVNAERALAMIIPDLKKLREACIEEWRNQ